MAVADTTVPRLRRFSPADAVTLLRIPLAILFPLVTTRDVRGCSPRP